MSLLRRVLSWTFDGTGNAIGSYRGALNVHDADVHREVISTYFSQTTATATTLTVAAAAGATSITVASATGFAINDYIKVNTSSIEPLLSKITNIVGTVFTLDRPLDLTHAIGDAVTKVLVNLNQNGTLASPSSFKVMPPTGKIWHIKRLSIAMVLSTAGDYGLFGNIPALTSGVVIRRYDGLTGTYGTSTIWRDNSHIAMDTGNISFPARSGGGGSYGLQAIGSFADVGAIIYLDGTAGDYLEVLIQDNLTGLVSFRIKAQGHPEGA